MEKQPISVLFARQEIYDSDGSVCAYELLYRDGEQTQANIDSADELAGDRATSFVLSHLFTHLDINTVIGPHPAYINFTRNHLLQKIPLLLPKNRIIIELLENIVVDEQLIETVTSLAQLGYRFALDDFVYRSDLIPLIQLADVIKIDVLALNEQQVKKQLALLKNFKGKLLAEKIETRKQLARYQDLGFDFFQGFFLNHPHVIHGQTLSENKTYLLKLFSELYDADIKLERIEQITLQTPTLSYRILRLANSASMYQGKKFASLMEAIQQLGLLQIRNWISLLLVSTLDDVSHDLLARTLIRAKMCQSLARRSGIANPNQAYTVGMLSTLDVILNEPMPSLLNKLPLSEELNAALLTRSGVLGYLLTMTHAYERGNFDMIKQSRFSLEDYSEAYILGLEYSHSVMEILHYT